MADFLYDKGREGFLDGSIDWDTGTIKAVLVTSSYTAVQATHDALDDIAAGYRVATATLSGKTVTSGVADATDTVFSSVTGSAASQIIIYQDASPESSARLIAHIDSYAGLPVTPNGGDINVAWPNDANKIFKL